MTSRERELAAIERVASRVSSLTRWIATAAIVPAVLLIWPAYLLFREIQFEALGLNITYVSAGAALMVTVAPAIWLGRRLCRTAVRIRRPAWIEEAASEQSIPASSIQEFFGEWNA